MKPEKKKPKERVKVVQVEKLLPELRVVLLLHTPKELVAAAESEGVSMQLGF